MEPEKHLVTAQGYYDLGMFQQAWDALEEIDPADRSRSAVLLLRLKVLAAMEKWSFAKDLAHGALRKYPDCPGLCLAGADVVERCDGILKALEFLEARPSELNASPEVLYRMGVYNCRLDNEADAVDLINHACTMSEEVRKLADEDRELDAIRDDLEID